MKHGLYGVFVGSRWGMTRNKEAAIKTAKEHGEGAEVRRMDVSRDDTSWDMPTFHACSTRIWPEDKTND